jgi:hypothetical protein
VSVINHYLDWITSDCRQGRRRKTYLQVLVEEVQEHLVRLLVVGLDGVVLEITTCSHEAVDLVREPLDCVLGLDSLLPLLDIILRLVLRRQHDEGDGDAGCVVGIDHGRVAGGGSLEQGVLLRAQVDDLASPAVADHSPLLDAGALSLNLLQELRDPLKGLGRRSLGVEELAELLALVVVVRRVPADVRGLAVEEVWANTVSCCSSKPRIRR